MYNNKNYSKCVEYLQQHRQLVDNHLKSLSLFYANNAHEESECFALLQSIYYPPTSVQYRIGAARNFSHMKAPIIEVCRRIIELDHAALISSCYFFQGRDQAAVDVVNSLMASAEELTHIPILLSYW